MVSPLADEITPATLTFSIDDETFVVDPDTGVEVSNKSAVVVQAFLVQDKDSQETEIPGTNASDVFMTGYCVDPMILPNGIKAGAIADYEMMPAYGQTVRGKFRLHRVPPSHFAEVQEEIGDELEGYLNISKR